ncbi:VOC family protein [Microbispora sp. NBRC 16548]|uniref:VOC family protein n=1 Tax=Microbispora sp. NBRC 16548 TaxID=3030994 RepID=UPI00249F988F|nr:VOC family protein [Microbispora sp. NBRC 16548]GLX11150.1 methylmalonyl-CoA epimerase [Microbispora sp. NBRC 16548]
MLGDTLVRRFDHVAIAVGDLAEAVPLYHDLLGGKLIAGGDDENLGLRTIQLEYPQKVKIELIQPLTPDSYLAAYLKKHGPGFHHMTCFVPDVEGAVRALEAHGFETVGTNTSSSYWRETYVRPSSAFGTLLQLVSTELRWEDPIVPEGATVEDIIAGRLVWNDARPAWREDAK